MLLAIGVLNSWGAMQSVVTEHGIDYFPVTRAVIEQLQGAFTFIPVIIAIYYAGELVWRDRERRIHEIVDATPAPSWTMLVPKVLAVGLVLAATLTVGAVTGVLFQLAHGYTRVEPIHYLLWFLLPETINAWLLAVLAVFVQSLVPHKAIGWAVMLVYIVASVTLGNLGYEHGLYTYAHTIQVPISDMNGLGRFWIAQAWFDLYWTAFAVILLVAAHLLWRRGAETRFKPRLLLAPRNLTGGPVVILVLSVMVLWGTGIYIFDNTNVLNDYHGGTQVAQERHQADYEKALWQYHTVPQPKIITVTLNVALYPGEVRAETEGSYVVENRTGQPLSELHVRWRMPARMEMLDVGEATLDKDYKEFGYRIYHLAQPMAPGEQRTIRFKTVLEEKGFPNNHPLTRIVENGTFLDTTEIAPRFGMDSSNLLTDRGKRRKYGLDPDALRPAKLEDQSATDVSLVGKDSDWVDAEITLSTDADQVPLAPGYTVSDEVKDGRHTIVTRTEAPILYVFSLQSGRYAIARDVWTGADGKAVDLAVYYHPDHPYNVQRIITAMKASLDVYTREFSPYQFRQLRILEFPAYARFAQSFAGTIPFSESIGFVQNFKDEQADEKVDLVTFVTAHEIGHQWWAHQVIGADKQGMTMLDETFAQYSALLVMEKLYGKDQIRKFLKGQSRRLPAQTRHRGGRGIAARPGREPALHPLPQGRGRDVLAEGNRRRGQGQCGAAQIDRQIRLQGGALSLDHRFPGHAEGRGRSRLRSADRGPVRPHHALRPQGHRRQGEETRGRQIRSVVHRRSQEALCRRPGQGDRAAARRGLRSGRLHGRARQEGLQQGGRARCRTPAAEEREAGSDFGAGEGAEAGRHRPLQQAHRPELGRQSDAGDDGVRSGRLA